MKYDNKLSAKLEKQAGTVDYKAGYKLDGTNEECEKIINHAYKGEEYE